MKTIEKPDLTSQELDSLIAKYDSSPGALLGVLEEAQELNRYQYLSRGTLEYVAEKMALPQSTVYSVSTFYTFFNLRPQGDHSIIVCRGTACHTKGSKTLLEHLENLLNIRGAFDEGETYVTTPDNLFTVRTVACFGQCALAPILVLDGKIHINMNAGKLAQVLRPLLHGGK